MSRRACAWNENIGFVRWVDRRKYKFLSQLFRNYTAAEYVSHLDDARLKREFPVRDQKTRASAAILELLNELRTANGRSPFIFP
jgi:hypothetical protein